MKQCISRLKSFFSHLWQTLKKYVCIKRKVSFRDTNQDGIIDLVIESDTVNLSHEEVKYGKEECIREDETGCTSSEE